MQRMLYVLLLLAGIQTGKAQEKIYTQRNNVVKDGVTQVYTTYIRLYGDSGFVRTDFREGASDVTVTRGYYRRSGRFYQFLSPEPVFCLKRSGDKYYHCTLEGGYEHGWVTWLFSRGKPLRRVHPDQVLRQKIR